MPMTIAEKILAAHTDQNKVSPGQIIEARLDFIFANDITAPLAIQVFRQAGAKRFFDLERVCLVPDDHFVPNKDIKSAMQAQVTRIFAQEQRLPYYFEVGLPWIEQALLPELGLVLPGRPNYRGR